MDLGPYYTGVTLPRPRKFFCIQCNQTLPRRRFKPCKDVSSFMGTSLILHQQVLACHVETGRFKAKVML